MNRLKGRLKIERKTGRQIKQLYTNEQIERRLKIERKDRQIDKTIIHQ